MNDPDLSTKLKLMGVDVASFGDYFADERLEKSRVSAVFKNPSAGSGPPKPDSEAKQAAGHTSNEDMATAKREGQKIWTTTTSLQTTSNLIDHATASPLISKHGPRDTRNDPIKCLTYHDPFSSTYKKYIFTADGQHLVGGMMIGDTSDFTKLVSIVKKKVRAFVRVVDLVR